MYMLRLSIEVGTNDLFLFRDVELPFVPLPEMTIEFVTQGDCTIFDEFRLDDTINWNVADGRFDCACEMYQNPSCSEEEVVAELRKRGWGASKN